MINVERLPVIGVVIRPTVRERLLWLLLRGERSCSAQLNSCTAHQILICRHIECTLPISLDRMSLQPAFYGRHFHIALCNSENKLHNLCLGIDIVPLAF